MFKFATIFTHALIFILVTIIALSGKYNPAPPEPGATYGVWFTTLGVFNLLVVVSAIIQLRLRKVSVFIGFIIGLVILFFLTVQYIYPFLLELF